jgi:hypothetical protein
MASGAVVNMQCFMKIGTGVQAILIYYLGDLNAVMLVLLMGGIYDIRHDILAEFHEA